MSPLKITDARAAELAALDEAGSRNWFVRDDEQYDAVLRAERFADGRRNAVVALDFEPSEIVLSATARNALPDLLADRRTLLDALRRAVARLARQDGETSLLADLRALLAAAEGGGK